MNQTHRIKPAIVIVLAAALLALSILGSQIKSGDVGVGLTKSQPCWLCG